MRHTERADAPWSFVDGVPWSSTTDFLQWPHDPPLSDAGKEEAKATGEKVRQYVQEKGIPLHVVISSPFLRCLQTSVEVCRQLGPEVRIIIDASFGEIFGPDVFGDEEPSTLLRPVEDLVAYCRNRSVKCHPDILGKPPVWPESLAPARQRFASRFLKYLNRSHRTKRNFFVVTHADGVGAALSTMPATHGKRIERVEYGGLFLAQRQNVVLDRLSDDVEGQADELGADVEALSRTPQHLPEGCEHVTPAVASSSSFAPAIERQVGSSSSGVAMRPDGNEPGCSTLQSQHSWQIETANIKVSHASLSPIVYSERLRSLASSNRLLLEQVEYLLGMTGPLGASSDCMLSMNGHTSGGSYQSKGSSPSVASTAIFAADVGDTTTPFLRAARISKQQSMRRSKDAKDAPRALQAEPEIPQMKLSSSLLKRRLLLRSGSQSDSCDSHAFESSTASGTTPRDQDAP